MRRAISIATFLSCAALAAPSAAVPSFSDMVVFGDSLSDTGNIQSIFGTSRIVRNEVGYGSNGRFSNGAVWHEYLADNLGIARASASRRGGENYAHGGAKTDFLPWPTQGILWQGSEYLLSEGFSVSDSSLYVAWIGGNDVRGLVGAADAAQVIDTRIGQLGSFLGSLADAGADSILLPNLPDIGLIPEFRGSADSAEASALTVAWNAGIADLAIDLGGRPGVDVFHLDVFSIFNDILADPSANGFTNVTDECRSVVFFGLFERSCRGADGYLFWDDIHPTTAAHERLGWEAFNLLSGTSSLASFGSEVAFADGPFAAVPAPAGLALLGFGVLALGWRRRSAAS